jgi:hypothetical protein
MLLSGYVFVANGTDGLILEDEEEQLVVGCFDDGCKDIVVFGRRRGWSSGFVEERDGRARQEATSHVIIESQW